MIARVSAVLAVLWMALVLPSAAETPSGDTHIFIHYVTKAVRVRPSARVGEGTVDWEIVLHPNGKAEDAWSEKDAREGKTELKLGSPLKEGGAVYRVVDANTIVRRSDDVTHISQLTVSVNGQNCSAKMEYILKPGEKEFRSYSAELKQWAYYSSLEMSYSTCVIK